MKALVSAWIIALFLIAGGIAFLWQYEAPELEAKEAEQVTITAVDKAPVLSSGPMTFDASQPAKDDEDCPSSC